MASDWMANDWPPRFRLCKHCPAWRVPVSKWRRVCLAWQDVREDVDGCNRRLDQFAALSDLPFTDDTTGSDAELRALVRGTAAMGAGE